MIEILTSVAWVAGSTFALLAALGAVSMAARWP